MKLAICIPSNKPFKSECAVSLAMMMGALASNPPADNFGVNILTEGGSLLPQIRTRLFGKALEWGADAILCIDDDMEFPPHAAHMLISRNVDVISTNCPRRIYPIQYTAKRDGVDIRLTSESAGIEEVDQVGCAVALIKAEVLLSVPQPWFEVPYVAGSGFIGEDHYFCNKVRGAGFKIHIDNDLSKEIGHVGEFTYSRKWDSEFEPAS
jgi:hypothetical protein